MKLLEQVLRQRAEFLRRDLRPNRVICPLSLRYEFLGEFYESFAPPTALDDKSLYVAGMRVVFTDSQPVLEVALCL